MVNETIVFRREFRIGIFVHHLFVSVAKIVLGLGFENQNCEFMWRGKRKENYKIKSNTLLLN